MKRTFYLLKTLLVAVGLCVGASAWGAAALTKSLEIGGYKAAFLVDFQNKTWDGTAFSTMEELSSIYGVTASATIQTAYDTNNWYDDTANSHGLRLQSGGGRTITLPVTINKDDYIIINGGNASETYEISMSNGVSTDIPSASDYLCFKVSADAASFTLNVHRYNYLLQILVMTKDAEAETADYTINYKYNSNTIKTDEGTDAVGAVINASSSIWVNNVKYLLDGEQTTSMTLIDGENILNVNVSIAPQYTYTINAIDENSVALGDAATLTKYSGETATIYYPKGYEKNGVWYIAAQKAEPYYGYSYSFTANGSQNVTYTKDATITYFFEDGDLTFGGYSAGSYPGRYSNGSAKRITKSSNAYTPELNQGIYTMIVYSRNNSGKASAILPVSIRYANGTLTSTGKELTWPKGNANEQTVEGIEVPQGASIAMLNTDETYTSNAEIDYVILKKTGDVTSVSTTIAESGYTSLASAYGLDFANATDASSNKTLKAYVVSEITKTAVTLTSVESAPANTGVILKGTASTAYTIPVTNSPAAVGTNELSAAVTATAVEASNVYVVSGGVLKLFTGTEIPAGKAYLLKTKVPNNARDLAFSFDEEATGINNVENARQILSGDFYNLAGQRVAQPAKGLYIVNGKKVVIK